MNIKRCENEKELSDKFQNDLLKCYSLAPGAAKKSSFFQLVKIFLLCLPLA